MVFILNILWSFDVLQQPEPKMNFFQAIFSFVFGDGDPNLDFEERRWQTVNFINCSTGAATLWLQSFAYVLCCPAMRSLGGEAYVAEGAAEGMWHVVELRTNSES